ncbi:MAG: SGNH/GDSL hydrolase family protein [Calditrichaeota bacterium]|nr:MAG: SGNH/GDSL hydrolase family protein [Calditrichota bacterium]
MTSKSKNIILAIFTTFLFFSFLEFLSQVALINFFSEKKFNAYASHSQLKERYGNSRLVAHRHLGYVTSPNFQFQANRHNSLGFRGEEFSIQKPDSVFRIVCLGGSTTYSDGVKDYKKSFPYLLEKNLQKNLEKKIEVINGGIPGYTTLETLINFQTRILDLKPDLVIVYHCINDALARLVYPLEFYKGDYSGFLEAKSPFEKDSVFEESTILRILMIRLGLIDSHNSITRILKIPKTSLANEFITQNKNGNYPSGVFTKKSAKEILEENQSIFFERNLENLILLAKANGIEIVFSTFAFSPFFENKVTFYEEFQIAIQEGNNIIKEIAENSEISFFDFASQMPQDTSFFTDGIHFTEKGNQLKANLFEKFLENKNLIQNKKASKSKELEGF